MPKQKRDKPAITRTTTLESYLKSRSDLRIGVDSVQAFLSQLEKLGEQVTKDAVTSANNENRTTLMGKDILSAFEMVSNPSGALPIFNQIEKLSAKEISALSERIETWLKEN